MIKNFKDPSYLQTGNSKQQLAHEVLHELGIFEQLAPFDPVLTGTIPIEVDIPASDLDVICEYTHVSSFESTIESGYQQEKDFSIRNSQKQGLSTVIANFSFRGWEIEIFGQPLPVTEQMAYRHMVKEYQILREKGDTFKKQVIRLKQAGLSTEVAFAKLLGIKGDPYSGLLAYPTEAS